MYINHLILSTLLCQIYYNMQFITIVSFLPVPLPKSTNVLLRYDDDDDDDDDDEINDVVIDNIDKKL